MGDLWSTGERKAELKGQPLDPTCPAAKVGMVSLCTEAPAHEQTPGPGSRGGREERWAGQVGGGRCLGLVVLIGSRSESAPCIRGPGPASGPAWCCVARPFLKEQKARSHEPPSECVLGTYTRLLAGPRGIPIITTWHLPREALGAGALGQTCISGPQPPHLHGGDCNSAHFTR